MCVRRGGGGGVSGVTAMARGALMGGGAGPPLPCPLQTPQRGPMGNGSFAMFARFASAKAGPLR